MWTRKQVKTRGKKAFKRNYWKSVLIALILSFIIGGSAGSNGASGTFGQLTNSIPGHQVEVEDTSEGDDGVLIGEADDTEDASETEDANEEDAAAEDSANNYSFEVGPEDMPAGAIISIMAIVTIIVLAIVAFALALDAFIFNPLELGCQRYFFKNLDEDAKFSNVVFAFDHSYKNIAKTMFLRDLYIVLWSLLFVIPGIIKSYEYRMIPYILADNPEMPTEEVFAESKRLMSGNKWKAFVLDFSFIGWQLLSILTCGILSIFYVDPYQYSTNAALYEALKYGTEEA